VAAAREIQAERGAALNAAADQATLERIAAPDDGGQQLLAKAAQAMALSARAYHRTLRVARTIADLEGGGGVRRVHVAEALSFRRVWASAAQMPATAG